MEATLSGLNGRTVLFRVEMELDLDRDFARALAHRMEG